MPKQVLKLTSILLPIMATIGFISGCTHADLNPAYTKNSSVLHPLKVTEKEQDGKHWAIAYSTTYTDMNALFPRLGPVTAEQMIPHVQSFGLFVDFINVPSLSEDNIQHNRTVAAKMIANALNTRQDICLFITDELHEGKGVYRMFRFKYNCTGRFDIILKTEKSLPSQKYMDKDFNIRLIFES